MNALVPQNFGAVSAKFTGIQEDSLAAGVQAGYPILRIKGKVWTITRGGGEPLVLMRPDGDGPRNSVELVILKASQHVSKVWYENGYEENSKNSPDCFSANGVTPDPASKKRQSNACASCPMNQWGSRITPSGKPGKSCSDSKRVAVALVDDLPHIDITGGPMMLRVPAASLRDLASYGEKMQALGYPYSSVATRFAFDPNEAYPKLVLSAIRPLTDAEADIVLNLRGDRQVASILAEGSENAFQPAALPAPAAQVFEQPPAPKPVAAPAAPVAAPAAPPPAAVQAAPVTPSVTAPAVSSDFEASLDAQLDALLPD